jgi:hypothetical protein
MPYLMSVHDHSLLYLATDKIYTYNTGSSFVTPISNDLTDGNIFGEQFHDISALDESWVNGNYLYAGTTDGNVWRSINQGAGWNNVTGTLPDRFVTSVHASPTVASRVYVTHSGYKENDNIAHVHRSDNNGTSWIDISGDLPQIAVNDIFILPHHADSVLFVSTDGGVYATMNSGNHWERLGSGMPVYTVLDIDYDSVNHKLLAGTYARSLLSYDVDSMLYVAPQDTTVDTTFVSEIENDLYKVYPIPANDYLNVILKNTNTNSVVSLLNSEGKLLQSFLVKNYSTKINVSEYASGIYYIAIKRNDKQVVKKIVVMH